MDVMADRLALAKSERMECRILLKWWARSAIRSSRAAMSGALSMRRERRQLALAWRAWRSAVRVRRVEERCVAAVASVQLAWCFRSWNVEAARSARKIRDLQGAALPASTHKLAATADAEDLHDDDDARTAATQRAAHSPRQGTSGSRYSTWQRRDDAVDGSSQSRSDSSDASSPVLGLDPQAFRVNQQLLTDACEHALPCLSACSLRVLYSSHVPKEKAAKLCPVL